MSKKIPYKSNKSRTNPQSGAFYVTPVSSQPGEIICAAPLYRFVYASRAGLVMVLLLLSSIFVQGVERVYASEMLEVASETKSVPEFSATTDVPIEINQIATTPEVSVNDVLIAEAVTVTDVPTDSSVEEVTIPAINSESDVTAQNKATTSDLELVDSQLENSVDESNTELEVIEEETNGDIDAVTEVSDLLDDVTIDNSLLATTTVIGAEVLSYTESDSQFSFSKEECTELATGSFYCHKPQENILQDALFAAPDADGDMEIYLVRNGIETQVTTNTIDDAAPYYDQNSQTIVWHRLINDRYQIVSYDIAEGSERVLTNTAENNMEPTRQGAFTVWQRWIDGGWNIILFDGVKETQITKTTSHNVAPYIHGSLIVWNRHDQVNEKTIEMYDMVSNTYVTVEDPDGMSVSNPRMVFVYDSLHPNGDIVTKGYDVLAKKFIDLDSLPRELPEDIPSSDSTGETRALIQLKSNGKSEIEEVLPVPETSTSTSTEVLDTLSTTTAEVGVIDILTLDLTTATATDAVPEVTVSYEIPPIELDLVIPSYSGEASTTSTEASPFIE